MSNNKKEIVFSILVTITATIALFADWKQTFGFISEGKNPAVTVGVNGTISFISMLIAATISIVSLGYTLTEATSSLITVQRLHCLVAVTSSFGITLWFLTTTTKASIYNHAFICGLLTAVLSTVASCGPRGTCLSCVIHQKYKDHGRACWLKLLRAKERTNMKEEEDEEEGGQRDSKNLVQVDINGEDDRQDQQGQRINTNNTLPFSSSQNEASLA